MEKQRGFSLIEAVVAMAVFGLCFLPILDVQRDLLRQDLTRQQQYMQAQITRNAITLIKNVNFALEPEGSFSVGEGVQVSYTSQLSVAKKRSIGSKGAGYSRWQIGIYDVTMGVEIDPALYPRLAKRQSWSLTFSRVGWD